MKWCLNYFLGNQNLSFKWSRKRPRIRRPRHFQGRTKELWSRQQSLWQIQIGFQNPLGYQWSFGYKELAPHLHQEMPKDIEKKNIKISWRILSNAKITYAWKASDKPFDLCFAIRHLFEALRQLVYDCAFLLIIGLFHIRHGWTLLEAFFHPVKRKQIVNITFFKEQRSYFALSSWSQSAWTWITNAQMREIENKENRILLLSSLKRLWIISSVITVCLS